MTSAALAGLRVIEVVGPGTSYAGRLFSGMGAEVILIEPPDGAPERHQGPFIDGVPGFERSLTFAYLHAGKRSIALDLDRHEAQAIFERLVERADVVLDGSPPGVMERRGLDYDALQARNASLVVTTVTPFGSDGPARDLVATDLTLLAMGGLLYLGGYEDAEPIRPHGDQALLAAGQFAAVGTMMAVFDAERSGVGQRVDVSIQECMTMALENAIQYYDLEGVVRRRRAGGQVNAGSGVFPCADGEIYLLTGDFGSHWRELGNWLVSAGFLEAKEFLDSKWETREWLSSAPAKATFNRVFLPFSASKTKAELFQGGKERKIPLCPVNTPADIAHSEQLEARGYFTTVVDAERGRELRMPGAPFRCSETPFVVAGAAPIFGGSVAEVCAIADTDLDGACQLFEAGVLA